MYNQMLFIGQNKIRKLKIETIFRQISEQKNID